MIQSPQFEAAEALEIDRASIGTILELLDWRGDQLSVIAARIIRSQEITILSLENEIVEADWRVLAHATEIERMADHRYALVVAANSKRAK